eukprot:2920881-Prymnesium_polylepis.1
MTPPPKTPARCQRAPVPTRATVGRASPIACSSGLSLVQGDFTRFAAASGFSELRPHAGSFADTSASDSSRRPSRRILVGGTT